jgi:hypothetical protein
MATTRRSGITGFLKYSDTLTGTPADVWLAASAWSISTEASQVDASAFDNNGWYCIVPSLKRFSGTITASYDSNLTDLGGSPPLLSIGQEIRLFLGLWTINIPSSRYGIFCNVLITGWTWKNAVEDAVRYNIQFEGDGAVGLTDIAHISGI